MVLWVGISSGTLSTLIFSYLTPLPLFLIGLSMGITFSMIGIASAVMIMGYLLEGWAVVFYLLLNGIPILLIVYQGLLRRWIQGEVLEWYPIGRLLGILTGLGLISLISLWLIFIEDGLHTTVKTAIQQVILSSGAEFGLNFEDQSDFLTLILPGLLIISWLLYVILNAILAQALLVRFHYNIRPFLTFAQLSLAPWISWLFLITVLLGNVSVEAVSYLAINTMIILSFTLFFGGLSVIHAIAGRFVNYRLIILLVFYILMLVTGWPAFIAIALGLIEPWLALRRRLDSNTTEI